MLSPPLELLGLPRDELDAVGLNCASPDRTLADKVLKAVHRRGETDMARVASLNKTLCRYLTRRARVTEPRVVHERESVDGTRKWLLQFADGACIESVFVPHGTRGTLCVSSQVGCALGCAFCATARMGFTRNLSSAEIVAQLWLARHRLGARVTNVVFMGMGEPLLNVDAVAEAVSIMIDDHSYGLAMRRVTLSTAGHVPGMRALSRRMPMNLAVSLHAPDDALRSRLMPINRKYPIARLLDACCEYAAAGPGVVVFEYALLDGVNDGEEHARALSVLLAEVPCKINLMRFNAFPGAGFQAASGASVRSFYRILADAGYVVTIRRSRGADVVAACGQLNHGHGVRGHGRMASSRVE